MRATGAATLVAGLLLAVAPWVGAQEPAARARLGANAEAAQASLLAARAQLGLVGASVLRARASMPLARASVLRATASMPLALAALAASATRLRYGRRYEEAGFRAVPAEAWAPQDPADSLYRAARDAMNRGDFRAAARMFEQLRQSYAESEYLADSYYWQAFALYRTSEQDELRRALELIEVQEVEYADAATRRDARALEVRIEGQLARTGDALAAARVAERASRLGVARAAERAAVELAARASRSGAARPGRQEACEEDEVRVAALNALMQMDPEQAVPVLKKVLERRDACSAEMRRQAVFVLSQHGGADVEEAMVDVVINDPDPEVKEAAVFWLSQVGSERAVDALEMILDSDDEGLQEKAVFALSQLESERAGEILRRYAQDSSKPEALRADAIFWLSQHGYAENSGFLIDLYGDLDAEELKEKVFFALSQLQDETAIEWMLQRAMDTSESIELRKQALFWAGQGGADLAKLEGLYDSMPDREMKEQLIFAYAQRHEAEAVERLIEIARTEEDAELRKRAIFWLGQTGDERAALFLLELIEKP